MTQTYVAACAGKITYPTPTAAYVALKRQLTRWGGVVKRRPGRELNAYRCPVCSGWHVGSKVKD